MDEQSRRLALWETVGSVIWFLMDGCWMRGWGTLATVLILPTLLPNLMAFRYTERRPAPLAITAAMNSWLVMNCCWMVADLGGPKGLLTGGDAFFALGVALIGLACVMTLRAGGSLLDVLGRFRRFRFGVVLQELLGDSKPEK